MIQASDMAALADCYPAISRLPGNLVAAMLVDGRKVIVPAGRTLFAAHEPCSSFLMIVEGVIRVSKSTRLGREIVLYRLQPGESCILTVSCLLGRAVYPARGLVEQDLTAFAISQPLFIQLLEQSGAFREFVFNYFAERITGLMELLEDLGFRQLDQRLAAWLSRYGPDVEATHQMLADELGSVREVISRILKDFECRGLVRLERGRIRVVNADELQRIAWPGRDPSH